MHNVNMVTSRLRIHGGGVCLAKAVADQLDPFMCYSLIKERVICFKIEICLSKE